ncbi:iron dicitrate transporter FecR [Bacteroidia bacterium]|nr:iron dicitrate transporter FecR [Bacteroidia bacterium]
MTDKEQQENRRFVNLWQITHPVFNPSGIDVEKAEAIVRKKINRRGSIALKMLLYWQRIAAVLLIPLIGLSAYLYLDGKEAAYQGDEYQVLKSPYGTCSHVSLPDGSNVWLNGGTELRYPLKFKPGKRLVQLNGEAYFEISSDLKNPFVVQTAQMNLSATGTKFNVEAYAGKTLTAVTMVEGKLNVAFGESSSLSLLPETRTCYDSQTGQRTLEQANPYKWYAWKDGLMIFRNDSLGYVFSRLAQTFNVSIILKDPSLSDAPYRATFEDESLDEILRLLEMTAPIKFVYQKRSKTTDGHYEKQIIEAYRNKKNPI